MNKFKTTVVIMISGYILIPGTVFAWDDCPKGLVDDPYPGECARYIDTDNDGICDHSQPAPEDRGVITQSLSDSPDIHTSDGLERDVSDDEVVVPAQQVDSTRLDKDKDSKQKLLMAIGIVFAHLIGILSYVTYKKRKAK